MKGKKMRRKTKELLTLVSIELALLIAIISFAYINTDYVVIAWIGFIVSSMWILLQAAVNGDWITTRMLEACHVIDDCYKTRKAETATNEDPTFDDRIYL